MSKRSSGGMEIAVRVVVLVMLAVFVLMGLAVLLLLVFVPVVGWLIWRLLDRTRELEKKVADLENPSGKKSD